MPMHDPPHPGEFITTEYLAPLGVSVRRLAALLDVPASTLARVIRRERAVTPELALRLSIAIGRSPESWLAMQHSFDLWQARRRVNLKNVKRLDVDAA
jgi:addiction module HigA family antidote